MTYDPAEALKLDNQLCFPLYAAARKVTGLYTPYLKELGLTYTQYIVLLVLWERDGLSLGEIGDKLCLDSGTLTPLCKKLETAGLIVRRRSEEDERSVRITLTDAGRALKERAAEIPQKVGSCLPLSPDEAVTLYALLHRILDA
ncbi:MAG: MarR family transcriptional regulator [Oscillospiraceae bacterium]|nr:MarR family transcriptional regulator [Oscillospiraceae bacterium]